MVLPPEIMKDFHRVPEEIIIDGAKWLTSQGLKGNNLQKLLDRADVFRHAGMTPIYLANYEGTMYTVTSEETFEPKKLH